MYQTIKIQFGGKNMSENLLSIKNICKKLGEFELSDITLELEKGSIMGLVGDNGAGKTTLLKLILNAYSLDAGVIEISDHDHMKDEIYVKNQIGYVSDESYLYYNASLNNYRNLNKEMYEEWDDELFSHYVEKWKLPLYKKISDYSKGMKKLAMFALALAHHPKVLLLDEPTAGLDPVVRMEFLDIVRNFTADGEHSVLFSSHITSDLDKIADYVAVIVDGSIVENKSIDELEEKYLLVSGDNQLLEKLDCKFIGIRKGAMNFETLVLRKEIEDLTLSSTEKLTKKTPNIENIVTSFILENKK